MIAIMELAQTIFELPAFAGPRRGRCLSSPASGSGDPHTRSDETLMQDWQAGDPASFPLLYSRFADRLFRFVLRMAATRAEAEEICQETWLAVIDGRARYRPNARFVTYLFSIAQRRSIDRLRRSGRQAHIEPEDGDTSSQPDQRRGQPDHIAHDAQNAQALLAAIAELPALQREAFLMKAEGDMSLEEIAEATGSAREAVKSRLRYAMRRLRQAMAEFR